MGKHQKHIALVKPHSGFYARNEWGLVGTKCGVIKRVAIQIAEILGSRYKISYMDADHGSEGSNRSESPYSFDYEDKISYHQIKVNDSVNHFDFKILFGASDIHLINGNHFKSDKQIVFIDADKKDSLNRRVDQLKDIRAILLNGSAEIFDFIADKIKDRNIPVYMLEQIEELASLIETDYSDQSLTIKGLILAGGKSERMGMDKSLIDYHGKPQALHLYELLGKRVDSVYISTTKEKTDQWEVPVLADSFEGLGPFGAILTAFRSDPNAAWLVVACDLPMVDDSTLTALLENRDPSKYATAFHNPETDFPDPLITLWEPKSYRRLLEFLSEGYSCPRKVLINSDIQEIPAKNIWLKNVNSPDDLKELKVES